MITQADLNAAMREWTEHGNLTPWKRIMAAVYTGEVVVEMRHQVMLLRAVPKPATLALGERLQALHKSSGRTLVEVGKELDMSSSSISRHLHGYTLGSWVTIRALVQALGGDPAQYRADYDAAKAERGRRPRSADDHL